MRDQVELSDGLDAVMEERRAAAMASIEREKMARLAGGEAVGFVFRGMGGAMSNRYARFALRLIPSALMLGALLVMLRFEGVL